MTVRLFGALSAIVLGLCALVAFAVIALSPTSVAVPPPADGSLLIAQLGSSDSSTLASARARLPARVPTDEAFNRSTAPAVVTPPIKPATPMPVPKVTPAAPTVEASLEPYRADVPPPAAIAPPPKAEPDVAKNPVAVPPPVAKPPPRVVDHRYDNVFTVDEIKRLKSAMRLSPDQEPYWGPVAGLLRDIGRDQMAQIDAGKKPEVSMDMSMMQRFYSAASPLIQTLREDQKAEIRRRAHKMGLGAYASYI